MKTLFILVAIVALIAIVKTPHEVLDLTGAAHTPSAYIVIEA
jgi:hypothetical protein